MMISRVKTLCFDACKFLQETIDRPPGSVESLESIQYAINNDLAFLYEFRKGGELFGVIMISFEPSSIKQYLNVNIFGGKDIKLWRDDLIKFLAEMTGATNSQLIIVSRKGWGKIFPELKSIGEMYTLR